MASSSNDGRSNVSVKGLGFASVLTIVFIVLKLCHVIDWSWLWVLSPLWISAIITVLIVVIFFLFIGWINRR